MKITCKCIGCGHTRTFTDDDPIDEAGPHCDECLMPMIPVKAEQRPASQDVRGGCDE